MTGIQWSGINVSSSFTHSSVKPTQFKKSGNRLSKCDPEKSNFVRDSSQERNPGLGIPNRMP